MKIHEYQGKEILRNFGVPVPRGYPAFTVLRGHRGRAEAGRLGLGGQGADPRRRPRQGWRRRWRARWTRSAAGRRDPRHAAEDAPDRARGLKVRRLLIEEGADIKKEYYAAALTDRATQKVAMMASSEGGMDIEEVAHSTPEKIVGLRRARGGPDRRPGRRTADGIGVPAGSRAQSIEVFQKLYQTLHGHRCQPGRRSTR